jgi:hypothetical protein
MGQAKLRGTFEERKQSSIEKYETKVRMRDEIEHAVRQSRPRGKSEIGKIAAMMAIAAANINSIK